jgi:hypothetical protein
MKLPLTLTMLVVMLTSHPSHAQIEPAAGTWKTWFISSGKDYHLSPPPSGKEEITAVINAQKNLDSSGRQQIQYWNAGAPGYRWQEMINKLWMADTNYFGVLSNMLLGVSIYDATIAAWDTKYAYKRPRPFAADNRIKALVWKPESPSYPCEYAVAAGAASTIIAHFYPAMADSVNKLARQVMETQVAAGLAYPSDTRAGFELGKKIAEREIQHTKAFTPQTPWNGKMPQQPGIWRGKPMFPQAGLSKTVVLDSSSQFRPGPPPDFAKDMEELKKFKPTFRSSSNAFIFAGYPVWEEMLTKKIFEHHLNMNPPRAARIYASIAVATYDGFTACWDAKYAYWGTRPDQFDTSYRPVLIHTPPFPGYPSGHALMGGTFGELYSYFFPADKSYFAKRAKDGAESRFQGGIHFRSDNESGLELGRKIGAAVVEKIRKDGADEQTFFAKQKTAN